MRKYLLLLIVGLIFWGCSGISLIDKRSDQLYSPNFLLKIGSIKNQYKLGLLDQALSELKDIQEETLSDSEKALRRNLIGVILFSKKNYEQAIFNFDLALSSSEADDTLTSQILLNQARSYYKLGFLEKAFDGLSKVDPDKLTEKELGKHSILMFKLSHELGKGQEAVMALLRYFENKSQLSDLKSNPYFEFLLKNFQKLDEGQRLSILEDFTTKQSLVVGYLGYLEAEKLYYKNEKSGATDILNWVTKHFYKHSEIELLVNNFKFRVDNYAKVERFNIGVVLPLTGKKAEFGKRALMGLDSALRLNNPNGKFNIIVKDSEGTGALGSYRVKELIERNYASIIIGGLFSSEATKEYLEARKHGAVFISLSQIYLPKEQKDHLLLEVPGSVESQLGQVFSADFLNQFGKRAAILYPESERGKAYVNEFWRKAKLAGVDITGVIPFMKNQTDYREPVKNLLGLKFKREREEEFQILKEIYSLEEKRSARRLQFLKPQVDFDWLFVPAFPNEALQIIPSFGYFDAFGLNIVGGPSWRSKALSRESSKFGKLLFVGDNVSLPNQSYIKNFISLYKRKPRLIEMRSFDALKIALSMLDIEELESRDELDMYIRTKSSLKGITGNWRLSEGVWLKDLLSLKLAKGRIEPIKAEAEYKEPL